MLPQDGWLADYMTYTDNSEADPAYHFWTGAMCISATLGRKVYVRSGHTTIYPNHYILLVGPTGNRKSSAIRIGEDLLEEAGTVHIIPGELTRRDISAGLKDEGTGLFVATEDFGEFLSEEHYKPGLIPFLAQLCEGRMQKRGTTPVSVCFNLLAEATTQWLHEDAHPAVLGPDFMGLVILAVAHRHRYLFNPPRRDEKLRGSLVARLREMAPWRGEVPLTPPAAGIMSKWYVGLASGRLRLIDDPRVDEWYARKQAHALKMCLVLCASQGATVINQDILEQAIGIIDEVEDRMLDVYLRFALLRKDGYRQLERIVSVLEAAPDRTMSHRTLRRRLQHRFESSGEFQEQMEHLIGWGLVTAYTEEREGPGRRATLYLLEPHVRMLTRNGM
ncbi:hypothetical protein MYX64_08980 [Nitrospinae bacterium AH_259_B05_G02_I21]|nr:hypothetical protein [Nitrospinae bacterium AH_259_B05_G02_I21]